MQRLKRWFGAKRETGIGASIVTLTGWGQPHDALRVIAPGALHFDFAPLSGIDAIGETLVREAPAPDLLIGWSLGGQLAARLVAKGAIRPKRLLLIAPSYQYLAGERFPDGMKQDLFEKFYENYKRSPERTIDKSWALVAKGDARAEQVSAQLMQHRARVDYTHWLRWLDELAAFSCDALDFSGFPPATLLHGAGDVVSQPAQSHAYMRRLPCAALHLLQQAGHAPHLHDIDHALGHIAAAA